MPRVMSRAFYIDTHVRGTYPIIPHVKCQSCFASFHSKWRTSIPLNPHIGAIPHSFLIALILQSSLTQVCRSSFPRTLISSLENLYICEDGYPRLGWQDDTENAMDGIITAICRRGEHLLI